MPSGAKKRKAAKKKQANSSHSASGAPSPTSPHSHGGDSGEVGSPASQDDHTHQHPFAKGEGEELEKREDSSAVRSFVDERKSSEGGSTEDVGKEEEGVVQIDWELKPEEDFDGSNVASESGVKSPQGSSSSSSRSSSSSSDDESHFVEKKIVVVEDPPVKVDLIEPLNTEKVTQVVDDFSVETSPLVDLVKPVDFLTEGLSQANDSGLVVESNNVVVETPSVADSGRVSLLEQAVQVIESPSFENGSSSGVIGSSLTENGMDKSPSVDDHNDISLVPTVLDSKSDNGKNIAASTQSEQYVGSSTDAKISMAEVTGTNPSNGRGHANESVSPQSSDSQPLVASVPRTAQTTSWKSCCGILELFTGSDR